MSEDTRGKGTAQESEDDEEATVTLTLDDGSELECAVLSIFPAGENQYIALIPLDQEDSDEGEVYLYRFQEFENGEIQLDNIIDDEEYELVSDAFDELLDSEEFDEMFDDED
ncbi:MAG TPA: DUF1292 domain-containing protein [Candidatus Scybalocola faecigallinarum]|uniref:DUF1292 domain-containing protein n=1 Tax=Candidatus Scybalocola faecigallinarum TaxID=2840941 RepID=A0A9D1JRC6_9FIRM|nr:DUF1292 domain-containing protein [Candidatus Scybalocola faecigallinarum]